MVKIKTKKKMNLPELIQWGWDSPKNVESKIFKSDRGDYSGKHSEIQFSVDGLGIKTEGVTKFDNFTVEVEEEITEETVIPKLVGLYEDESWGETQALFMTCTSIKDLKDDDFVAFYMLNDDMTMTLLWKDGELVDEG